MSLFFVSHWAMIGAAILCLTEDRSFSYGTPQPALKREVFNGTTFLRLNNNKDVNKDALEMDERATGYFTPLVKQRTLQAAACESPRVQPVATMMRTRVVYNEVARGINHEAAV